MTHDPTEPRPSAGLAPFPDADLAEAPARATGRVPLRARLAGPWRVAVADGSMKPAIEPGDWLLVDPTVARWPRRGSVVVFREPTSDLLAIKRVAGRPGDEVPFARGRLRLAPDEAWLLSDASDEAADAAGDGHPIDSRRYGPVTLDQLIGRVWLRYWPRRRLGRIAAGPPIAELLARGDTAPGPPPGAYGPIDIEKLLAEERESRQG